ncbi:MAG: hypothetical protein JWM07_290 [Candidatus Saccharibacteria bacterium]|nr:hypothetical protein [Candidatus Saccharibacteria bacterium]
MHYTGNMNLDNKSVDIVEAVSGLVDRLANKGDVDSLVMISPILVNLILSNAADSRSSIVQLNEYIGLVVKALQTGESVEVLKTNSNVRQLIDEDLQLKLANTAQ